MPADTFKYHEQLTETDGLHIPKTHALSHALGGTDALDIATMPFDSVSSSQIKTYIDSQISGENHWDMNSGNTEIYPHVLNIDVNLNAGSLTTTENIITSDLIKTRDFSINYTDNKISSVVKSGGRTLTITRTPYGYPSTITDGTRTWTYTYNSDNTTLASVAIT